MTKKEPLPDSVLRLSNELKSKFQLINEEFARQLYSKDDRLEYAMNNFYGELMKFDVAILKYEGVI